MRGMYLCALLVVSVGATAATPVDSRPASQSELAMLKTALEGQLKDPYSAKFRNVKVGPKSPAGMYTACGMVNAKNSYGAYAGEEPFYGQLIPEAKVAIVIGVGDAAGQLCAQQGLM